MITESNRVDCPARAAVLVAVLFCSVAATGFVYADALRVGDVAPNVPRKIRWHTDYDVAYRTAKQEHRLLLVNFVSEHGDSEQQELEALIDDDLDVQDKLGQMVLVRVATDVVAALDGQPTRLLDHPAYREMHGAAGIAIVDLAHDEQPYYGKVISAYPFTTGKYYHWQPEYLSVILDLPPGTITQRTMVWAVRVHPERPASTDGRNAPELTRACEQHSRYQARVKVQGHQHWSTRFARLRSRLGISNGKEVVAESWPDQTMVDSCLDCVASWRQSPGHWGAVRGRHRLFGYDIQRGDNGIWYGTGIFAD